MARKISKPQCPASFMAPGVGSFAHSIGQALADAGASVSTCRARQLIHPLLPWLRDWKFNGPLQVTAVKRGWRCHVIEYNIRKIRVAGSYFRTDVGQRLWPPGRV